MNRKQIYIRRTPFIRWSIGIFVLCLLPLLVMISGTLSLENRWRTTLVIASSVAVVVAVGGAFVICGIGQVIREYRSGYLVFTDLLAPAMNMIVVLGLFALVDALFPPGIRANKPSLWGVILIAIILNVVVWTIRKRRNRR